MDKIQSPSLLKRLNPCRKDSEPPSPTPSEPDTEVVSQIASSCEIFNLFKTLAKTKNGSERPSVSSTPSSSSDKRSFETVSSAPPLPSPTVRSEYEAPIASASARPSNEVKIAVIQEDFGILESKDSAGNIVTEQMLLESEGTLYKGTMVIGNIHLTTHRLLFHALLPPDEAFVRKELDDLGSTLASGSDLLHTGPVSWHRHKALNPSQRVWMELTIDRISLYPSADESGRVRPIKTILLSSVESLHHLDPARPTDIYLSYLEKSFFFTVDTPESAAQWRRQIEAALFRIRRVKWRNDILTRSGKHITAVDQWETLRFCVPLDRLTTTEVGDYHGFATLVGLQINLAPSERVLTELAKGTSLDLEHLHLDESNHFNFNLGVITNRDRFVQQLSQAIQAASLWKRTTENELVFSIAGMSLLVNDDDEPDTLIPEDSHPESLPAKAARKAAKTHLAAIALGLNEEEDIWLKRCYVEINSVPVRGHLILTPRFVCFWRKNAIAQDIKYRFERTLIKSTEMASGQPGFSGLALKLHGRADIKFDFWNKDDREQALARLSEIVPVAPSLPSAPPSPTLHPADILAPSVESMTATRILPDDFLSHMPFIANKPFISKVVGLSPRTFALLTIGSRGDVQPYIALGIRLRKDGHRVVVVTHEEFKGWIEGYGLEHRQAGGDPTALMKLSAEHKILSPGFFKESISYFRGWLDDLLVDAWEACKDADVLIESPSAMAGIHIAERLRIPYFRAFTMPWTRTTAYPQAFMVPAVEMGPSFNFSTYVIYDNVIWTATAGQINRWRKQHLELGPTDMSTLSPTKIPFLYNFSQAVVPKPLDWRDDIAITGYWNLENSDSDWSPPAELDAFMEKAQLDGKPLVYIGFGSIVVPKPNEMTNNVIEGVEKADVRAVVARGWSARSGTKGPPIKASDACFFVDKVPHGWLFPRVQAALHHGGAGTVGASLRAGLPTLLYPFFGDQFFWANRVTKLGVGLKVASLRSGDIADALTKATTDRVMREKAARIGEAIRKESGVDNAVEAINYYIVRAGEDRKKLSY